MRPRRALIPLLAASAALAAVTAAPADAGTSWVVRGGGWGHGVGMSQYGAFGYAERGRGYKRILAHYYRDTRIAQRRPRDVRVLITTVGALEFRGASRACGRNLRAGREYRFADAGDDVLLQTGGGRTIENCGREGGASGGRSVKFIGVGSYRGRVIARQTGGGLNAINQVGIEGYVRGVIPNEVPASWPMAALRAQAVAARSYALATTVDGDGYDLYDDTRSQVYGGRSSEHPATNRATRTTAREVLKHGRSGVIVAYFFSTSGGETENVEYGFIGADPVAYLKGVNDPHDDASPYHRWKVTFSDRELESRLHDLFDGNLRRIEVVRTGRSPRIVQARVVGSRGSGRIAGDALQFRLGLRSTWFRFDKRRTKSPVPPVSGDIADYDRDELPGYGVPAPPYPSE